MPKNLKLLSHCHSVNASCNDLKVLVDFQYIHVTCKQKPQVTNCKRLYNASLNYMYSV